MDIRNIFKEVSEQLLSDFRKSAEIRHPGGKGEFREDAFRNFLRVYLPTRYAIGSGEVITAENRVSGELDITIYDPSHCPALIKSTSHSVYPIESIYGAISIKSHLDAAELKNAYENIRSLKNIVDKQSFQLNPFSGFAVGMSYPMPITGIVAYDSNRSLEAIAEQVKFLDSDLPDINLRPDFVAIIGQGIIAPRQALRGEFNHFSLPADQDRLAELRKTGRHTLLRLYMQILRELNALTLRPLELGKYDDMPRLIGKYRVGRHNRFVRFSLEVDEREHTIKLNEAAIEEIVSKSKPVTHRQHLLNYIGSIPAGVSSDALDDIIHEYNPNNLPPVCPSDIKINSQGRAFSSVPAFQPVFMTIDGKQFAVDISSLSPDHFDEETDFTVDELMSG